MGAEKTLKNLLRLITNPLTGFIFFLSLVATIIFLPPNGPNLFLFSLIFPWLVLINMVLNLSFISSIFRRFTLSDEIKKNHALEHGTIFFLKKRYGARARIGGMAEKGGFRICGVQKREHLVHAFDELIKELKKGNSASIISMRCGSNIATAQGLGIILLSITAIILVISGANKMVSLEAIIINILLYLLLRTRLGNWVQGKFFTSLEFSAARIQSIYNVEKKYYWEINPVLFIKTSIS